MEDFLGRFFRNDIPFDPGLNISARIFSPRQAERFTTNERHGLGFDFFQITWSIAIVAIFALPTMTQRDMSKFVEGRLILHRA
jgi:hypothetical protein